MQKKSQQERNRPAEIYELKITILDTKPPIWRRVAVPGDVTLAKLHKIIQIVIGWTDSHLHEFRRGGRTYAIPDPGYDTANFIDERRIKLNEIVAKPGNKINYCYDFGDDWQHQIYLERTIAPLPNTKYPLCLAGKRACPPEDCGGPFGYGNFLEAIADPEHEEHELMIDWIGDEFDPDDFDISEVNDELRRKFR